MGCGASNAATSVAMSTSPVSQNNQNNNRNTPSHQNNQYNSRSHQPQSVASIPLVKAKSYRHGAHITQGELNNQRTEFWSTRTEGTAIMWQSIRSAAEAMLADDLPLANAILEASNLATPNGTLEVVYDERGSQYKVPQYCYANPLELTNQPMPATINDVVTESSRSTENTAVFVDGPTMKLRVRINPGDHNLTIMAPLNGTILNLKQMISKEAEEKITQMKGVTVQRQRIIFMGKELQNTLKIRDGKFDDAKVVQVFLRPGQ